MRQEETRGLFGHHCRFYWLNWLFGFRPQFPSLHLRCSAYEYNWVQSLVVRVKAYRNYLSLNNSNTRTWVKEASGKYKPLLCNRKKTFSSPLRVVSFQNTGVKAHICGSGRGCHFYKAGKKNLNILKEDLIWPSFIYFTHVQHFVVYFSSKNPLTTRHVHDTWSYT